VVDYLKSNERTLYCLVYDGKIPAFKVGNSWRCRHEDLEWWIFEQSRGTDTNRENGSLEYVIC
jgi:excisionase family DNA binding protein